MPTSIFEAIRVDHDAQRTLIDQLVRTTGDRADRRRLFAEVRRQLTAHASAEERFFYIPLMESDTTQDQARHSVSEHKELDDFIEQLAHYDMSGSQWLQTAQELRDRLVHHLDEEEKQIFPVAGGVLSDAEKQSLAGSYEADMERRRAYRPQSPCLDGVPADRVGNVNEADDTWITSGRAATDLPGEVEVGEDRTRA